MNHAIIVLYPNPDVLRRGGLTEFNHYAQVPAKKLTSTVFADRWLITGASEDRGGPYLWLVKKSTINSRNTKIKKTTIIEMPNHVRKLITG